MSAITSQYAETFADDAEQKQRANLEHLKVVVPRGLLHRVAGEGTKRLLHNEYGVDDLLRLHLLDVGSDHLHARLFLIWEEDEDLQGSGGRHG
jgi:hypothetical protein